jgi:hypothetical protein
MSLPVPTNVVATNSRDSSGNHIVVVTWDLIGSSNVSYNTIVVPYLNGDTNNVGVGVFGANNSCTFKVDGIIFITGTSYTFGVYTNRFISGQIQRSEIIVSSLITLQNFQLTISNTNYNSVSLSWSPVTNISSYVIADSNLNIIATTSNTTYTVSNLSSDTLYTFKVSPLLSGPTYSYSSIVGRTTLASQPQNVFTYPQTNAMTIHWNNSLKIGGATITNYYLSIQPVNGEQIATIPYVEYSSNIYSHTFSGLTNNVSYTITLKAKNGSTYGDPVILTKSTLSSPIITVTPSYKSGEVLINLSENNSISYTLKYKSNNDISYTTKFIKNGRTKISNLIDNTVYVFNLLTYNGTTGLSTATCTPTTIPNVTNLSGTISPSGAKLNVTINWTPPSMPSGFTLHGYRITHMLPTTPQPANVVQTVSSLYTTFSVLTSPFSTSYTLYIQSLATTYRNNVYTQYQSYFTPINILANSDTWASITSLISDLSGLSDITIKTNTIKTSISDNIPVNPTPSNVTPVISSFISNIVNNNSSNIPAVAEAAVTALKETTLLPSSQISTLISIYNSFSNTDSLNGVAIKSAIIQAVQEESSFTSNPIVLEPTETQTVLSSITNKNPNIPPPSSLTVYTPANTSLTLTSLSSCYILMKPNTLYNITYNTFTNRLQYNSGTKNVDQYNDNLVLIGSKKPGDSILFGNERLQLYASGSITSSETFVRCFPEGTRITTEAGPVLVEDLKTGDLVLTADGRQVPVKAYSATIKAATASSAPYLVPKKAFGLKADLHLSPLHAFQSRKGVWQIPLYAALSNPHVQQYGIGSPITYYHLECPNFFTDNLVVDGCVVESFGSNQAKGIKTLYKYNETLKGFTRASQVTTLKK